jgi:glucosylceramidase
MQTESECGNRSNDWKSAENTFALMKQYFNNGVNSYLYGNLVLDETAKSKWGGKQNSLVTVNREKNDIQFNPELYLFKHFSNFIKAGSYKVLVKGKYADILGFVTPSDDMVIILANNTDIPKFVRIKIGKKYIETVVAKHSFNTFLYYNAT